jgi:sugar lactone lactonase YvrE
MRDASPPFIAPVWDGVSIDILVEGLAYPEGPVWLGPEDVVFVELGAQSIRRWKAGDLGEIARTGGSPNGATLGRDGCLYIANNGGIAPLSLDELWFASDGVTGRIQRVSLEGEVEDLATDLPGPRPWRPNDLRFGPGGALYFTDPHNWEALPDRNRYGGGSICCLHPEGNVDVVFALGEFPNGLAFGLDWTKLFVAQSANGCVQVFELDDGVLGNPSLFCRLPRGAPDGITFDSEQRLYVASSLGADGGDAIFIYAPNGTLDATYDLPAGSDPTNLCIGDGGIYVTCGLAGRLVFIPHPAQPAPLLPS